MREIKFRAWDIIGNNMIFGNDILMKHTEDGYISEIWKYQEYTGKNDILMQYTGLKDKNGVEIYEGDILSVENYSTNGGNNPDWFDFIGEVKYYEAQFFIDNGIQGIELFQEIPKIEVIGNIYENKELL